MDRPSPAVFIHGCALHAWAAVLEMQRKLGVDGLAVYIGRAGWPYLVKAAVHLAPQQISHTEKTLMQVRQPRLKFSLPARAPSRK